METQQQTDQLDQLASHLSQILDGLPKEDRQQAMNDLQGRFLEADLIAPDLSPRLNNPLSFSLDLIDQNEALRQKLNANQMHEFDRAMKAKTPEAFADALV